MRAVVQRVFEARVEVGSEVVGSISRGLCAFVGAARGDSDKDIRYTAAKIANLRIFPDDDGKMSRSLLDIGGEVLAVSQFTLFGDVRRGRRPSFDSAMAPEPARDAYQQLVEALRGHGLVVQTGRFAADMRVVVDNDGPVTILIDSTKAF